MYFIVIKLLLWFCLDPAMVNNVLTNIFDYLFSGETRSLTQTQTHTQRSLLFIV